ncbi:alpha/beta hydrolase family protein [Nocardia asteroides]|uniref:alpha/beta hydrolase family protein n=1 Tax=Nocardia asteroides TaxID=1824 RepID=UPI0037C88CA6
MLLSWRQWRVLAVIAVVFLGTAVGQMGSVAVAYPIPAPPQPVETAQPLGRLPVGVRVDEWPIEGRSLRVTTWYPAALVAAPPYVTPDGIKGVAVLDAPPERTSGPYPLIVFSPGLGAPGDAYYFYTQNLASQGYVVVGIDHLDASEAEPGLGLADAARGILELGKQNPSDTVFLTFSNWFKSTQFGMTYRPQEIELALDRTLERNTQPDDPLYGTINPDKIAMSGHSLGAAYTLLKGGMAIDCNHTYAPLPDDWSQVRVNDIDPCAMPAFQALADSKQLRDPRIKAILPLASPVFISDSQIAASASEIDVPLMFLTGADPYFEASRAPQWSVYEAAQTPKYFVEIRNTDHFLVTDVAVLNPYVGNLSLPWNSADFVEKAEVYMRYSTAFFDYYIKGDVHAKSVLDAPSGGFVVGVNHVS